MLISNVQACTGTLVARMDDSETQVIRFFLNDDLKAMESFDLERVAMFNIYAIKL